MKQQHLQLAVDASRHGPKPTPFGVVEGESPMLAAAQLTIAVEAWRGISDALASRRGVEGPRTDAFEMALRAHFTQGLPTGLWMDAAWLKSVTGKREPADFGLAAWRSFVGSYVGWCARLKLPAMVVPLPRQIDDALVMQVLEEAGCAAVPSVDRGLDGLRLAWDTAQRNVERAEFRYAAAHTLASAARGRQERLLPTAEEQFSSLTEALWADRQAALVQLFAIGTLVGADAQPVLKSRAKGMFGGGMSVMHLLEVDGRSPSSFLVADEKRLRSQIDQA